MNTRLFTVFAIGLGTTVGSGAAEPTEAAGGQVFSYSPEVIEEIVAPIALHPDALVALILPAATSPSEIVLAARYLNRGGDPEKVDDQPWSDSVRGLARYPDLVEQLNEDLEWTIALGDAFMGQPADVMEAIQRLRSRAHANGSLQTTEQQTVVVKEREIIIVPSRPDVIYVPRYDTRVVYVDYPIRYHRPVITFGIGFRAGHWLTYDCDWVGHRVWWVDNRYYWRHHRDWRYPVFPRHPAYVDTRWRKPWTPPRVIHRPRVAERYRPVDPRFRGDHPRVNPPPQRSPRDPRWDERRGNRGQRYVAESRNEERLQPRRLAPRLQLEQNSSGQTRVRPGSPTINPRRPSEVQTPTEPARRERADRPQGPERRWTAGPNRERGEGDRGRVAPRPEGGGGRPEVARPESSTRTQSRVEVRGSGSRPLLIPRSDSRSERGDRGARHGGRADRGGRSDRG